MKKFFETGFWKLLAALGSVSVLLASFALSAVVAAKAQAAQAEQRIDDHQREQTRREDGVEKRLERIEVKIDRLNEMFLQR